MRRRILAAILGVTAVAIILFAVPLGIVITRLTDDQAMLRLERQAVLAARNVPNDFSSGLDPTELPTDGDISYRLYDSRGRLVTRSGPGSATPGADALTRQALTNRIMSGEIDEQLVVAIPIVSDEQVTGVLRAQRSTSGIDRRRERTILLVSALAAGIAALAASVGSILAGRLTRPIRELRDATVQLGTGDFAILAPTTRIPELAQSSAALAATAKRLDALVTRERSFSADASHQLRTPLTALRTTLESELAFPRKDATEALREALGDIDRLEGTVTELLDIAHHANRPSPIELAPILADLSTSWTPLAAARNRSITIDDGHYAPLVLGHPTMLRHAVDALIDNALQHGHGAICVALAVDDQSVTMTVSDEGPGFDSTQLEEDKPPHGLGLALARRLVIAQHGRLAIAPPPCGHIAIRLRRVEPSNS